MGGVVWEFVIVRPFPFADVVYVHSHEVFDEKDMGQVSREYALAVPGIGEQQAEEIRLLTAPYRKTDDKGALGSIKTFVRMTRAIMSTAQGDETRTLDTIVESSDRFMKICSEYAKLLTVIAQCNGVPARVVWMDGHTTSELFFPGLGWLHADAYGNIAFVDENGSLISLMEFRALRGRGKVVPLDDSGHRPDFSVQFEKVRHVYEGNDLYMVLSGRSLFSYPAHHRNPLSIALSVLNIRDMGYGIQYVGDDGEFPGVGNVGLDAYRHFGPLVN